MEASDPRHTELQKLEFLYEVGLALSAERNTSRLLERILLEAKRLCGADGGTIYLREGPCLCFAIVHNDSLGIALGGDEEIAFTPIPLFIDDAPNHHNVASYAAHLGEVVNVADAYDEANFDFSGTKAFDEKNGYRSRSFLTIPMAGHNGRIIGVLQLINAQKNGEVVAFGSAEERFVKALASQAAVALENQRLIDGQKKLLEAFIQMIASAIDSKSPYTGAHCERVPILTMMLTEAACAQDEGPFADFQMSDDEWYELKIAAWLHDCGKVTTPVHIMDKGTKLETITDRIDTIAARFEVLKRDAKVAMLEAQLEGGDRETLQADYQRTLERLDGELRFLRQANIGSEFLSDEAKERIVAIGKQRFVDGGIERALLSEDEMENLCISRGTLTEDERLIINGHMVQTVQMLDALPFPPHLRRVPEYAGGHHERFDGNGYPKGLYAGDMSVPARIMAIADVFEALTAQDRPYKKGKTLSESMRIMGFMKRDNHLDPDLLDLFVRSGVYKAYGEKFLPASLIDEVDEEALLQIQPKSVELPPREERDQRREGFLPKYDRLRKSVMG
ncbi:MAG: HD domain-containing phosphohydrolase [Myxococcota bacterium]